MPKKIRTIPFEKIREEFYVRVALNEDRVQQFVGLYEAGAELPTLMCTESGILVDGRTRKAALIRLGKTEARFEVIPDLPKAELIILAWKANAGGALPPSSGDMTHTVRLLFDQKMSRAAIVARLSEQVGLPPKVVRRFVDDVQSNIAKEKINRARIAVADGGFNVEEAAKQFDVSLDTLRTAISGKNNQRERKQAQIVASQIGSKMRTASIASGQMMRKVLGDFSNGDVTLEYAMTVIGQYEKSLSSMQKNLDDWKARINAIGGIQTKTTKRKNGNKTSALERMGLQ